MPSPDRGTTLGPELSEAVSRLRRALRRTSRAAQGSEGLPLAQNELLAWLADHPRSRVGDIAASLRLAPNTVTTLVNALESRDFVRRSADPDDRRVVLVTTTDAGSRELTRWQQLHDALVADALAVLDPADRAALAASLPALDHLVVALLTRSEP
ncbi:MAG TPA: MarR family winged helix-turn-helix transcriptional regulator [Mycobacteriales bacterium]|nr:MarR family winged helix-turn-helix transcriptional regulator [Mycobacteriales bacterium]